MGFLVADLVCATSVLPVFLGLITPHNQLYYLLPAPTELGAFLGCISGFVTVLINGIILGQGGISYFWLQNGAICALCGTETMITFIIVPLVSAFFTLFFTKLDLLCRGEQRARKPIIHFQFDDFNYVTTTEERNKDNVIGAVDNVEVDVQNKQVHDDFVPNPSSPQDA